jgi:hypothetical protein
MRVNLKIEGLELTCLRRLRLVEWQAVQWALWILMQHQRKLLRSQLSLRFSKWALILSDSVLSWLRLAGLVT